MMPSTSSPKKSAKNRSGGRPSKSGKEVGSASTQPSNEYLASFQSLLNQQVDLDDLPLLAPSAPSPSPPSPPPSSSTPATKKINGETLKMNPTPRSISAWDSRKITEAALKPSIPEQDGTKKNRPTPVAATPTNTLQQGTCVFFGHHQLLPIYRPSGGAHPELSSALKSIRAKTQAKITLSVQNSGVTFLLNGSEEECEVAKRLIFAQFTPKTKLTTSIPAAIVGQVVGAKGAVVQGIQSRTLTKIDFMHPAKSTTRKTKTEPVSFLPTDREVEFEDEDVEEKEKEEYDQQQEKKASEEENLFLDITEPVVEVVITGDKEGVQLAKEEIEKIVGQKKVVPTIQLSISSMEFPFLFGPYHDQVHEIETKLGVEIIIPKVFHVPFLPSKSSFILIKGDHQHDLRHAALALKDLVGHIHRTNNSLTFQLPYYGHKLVAGPQASSLYQLLEETGCVVEFPETKADTLMIRGQTLQLAKALAFIMNQFESVAMKEINLQHLSKKGPKGAKLLLEYLEQKDQALLAHLQKEHQTTIHFRKENNVVEVTGASQESVAACCDHLTRSLLVKGALLYCQLPIPSEMMSHPFLASILKQFKEKASQDSSFEAHVLNIVSDTSGCVDELTLLVFDPSEAHVGKQALEKVKKELTEALTRLPTFHSEIMEVPFKYHRYLLGHKGATLERIMENRRASQIRLKVFLGHKEHAALGPDQVLLRGVAEEVNKVKQDIHEILEEVMEAEETEKIQTEVLVPIRFSMSVLGGGRSQLSKYRERIGMVKIDVLQPTGSNTNLVLKLLGTPKAVQEVTHQITEKVKLLEDYTVDTIRIPHHFHRRIIGENWKNIKDIETQYQVKIHFPNKQEKQDDTIQVKGPSKGVQAAIKSLKKCHDHEEKHSFTDTLMVPASLVASLVGKNGVRLGQIKDATEARIDFPQKDKKEENAQVAISLKGTEEQVQLAKSILHAASQAMIRAGFTWESTVLSIPEAHHRRLVGPNGSNLRKLLSSFTEKKPARTSKTKEPESKGANTEKGKKSAMRESGKVAEVVKSVYGLDVNSSEPTLQADVRFNKSRGDQVELRAATVELLENLKTRLLAQVNDLEDETTLVLHIPTSLHPSLIGKGGSLVRSLQEEFHVRIDFKSLIKPTDTPFISDRTFEGAGPMGSIYVSGPSEQAHQAIQAILQRTPSSTSLQVPFLAKQHVMGRQGQHLRKLRTQFHVNVTLPSRHAPLEVNELGEEVETWIVQGTYDDVQASIQELQTLIQGFRSPRVSFEINDIDLTFHRLVIGPQGSTISRIRKASQCQIQLERGDPIIRISGPSEENVQQAEKLIREVVSNA